MYIKNTLIVLCIATVIYNVDGGCSWCENPVSTCAHITDSRGWTLARAISPAYGKWFPYTDALQGNDAAADDGASLYNIGPFSENVAGFNQFLFVHGDCSAWLIASKEAVNGAQYSNAKRQICSSSESADPTQANWYNRGPSNPEDPWLCTVDYGITDFMPKIVYGENSQTGNPQGFPNGVYVYIRKVNDMDQYGCGTSSSVDCGVLDIDGFLADCSNEWTALTNEDTVIVSRIDGVDTRIDGVDTRIDGIDDEIEDIKEVLQKLKGGHAPGIGDFVFSAENGGLLILCMLTLNLLVVIGGCIACMLWMKSKNQYSKYDKVKVYESNSENERQKLQN